MSVIGQYIDKNAIRIIERAGPLLHPLILKLKDESKQFLIYYFHGLYEDESEKEFHHVDPQNNLIISQFRNFIDYFSNEGYRFVNTETLSHHTSKPLIMLTFDDGYFNNMLALPVLNEYKVPATFFITTRNVVENKSYWWDIIYKYRFKQGNSLSSILSEQNSLKRYKYDFIEDYIINTFGSECAIPWSDIDRPLTSGELKTLASDPLVTIGNHTHNHSILTNYTEKEIENELVECNNTLVSILGTKPDHVAFPNGNHNNEVINIAGTLGFRFAFTTINDVNPTGFTNEGIIKLNRFMAQTSDIHHYADYDRLNYRPSSSYYSFKKKLTGK